MPDLFHAKNSILTRMQKELPPSLTYHGWQHTQDVHASAVWLAEKEKVTGHELLLIETAAWYHDCGFLKAYTHHENLSCEIVRETLPAFGYEPGDINRICQMILATQIPQSPQNHSEQILCDADLDYLGRDDFFRIGNLLFQEFLAHGIVTNEIEWNRLQVKFLEGHHYFTPTALAHRAGKKEQNLRAVKDILAGS